MNSFQRLQGRVALITGAASGIGLATAKLFLAEGARVVAVDRPGSGIETVFAKGQEVAVLERSVTDADAPEAMLALTLESFGGLDILFNNAGVAPVARVEALTDDVWEQSLAVNVTAVMRTCRVAIPHLRARARQSGHGRIINTASIMANFSDCGMAAYAASKHALAGLTKTLAVELGADGITANYLLPGAIETGITRGLFSDQQTRRTWSEAAAVKRLGTPEDIARAALLLASDEADFITGHGLVVDGGVTLSVGPRLLAD